MRIVINLSIIFLAFLSSTCTFPGPVYVMVVWDEVSGRPSVFNHTITGVPASIASVVNGQYYPSKAGVAFDITNVSYVGPPSGPFMLTQFTLEANNAVLGNEPAFYDIRLFRNSPITITKVPS